jgi:tetratricopeptide (TPR) repeat protein
MTKKRRAQEERPVRNSSRIVTMLAMFALALAALPLTALAASSLQLQTLKTHSRLSIQLDPSVETDWKETSDGFRLVLKGVALQDLYLGGAELETLRDSRISSVQVEESGNDVVLIGKWNFSGEAAAFANPKMERFTYRERDPARFVVDFWPKGGTTKVEAEKKKKDAVKAATIAKAEADAKRRRDRRIAAEQAMAIESDVARFCKEPLQDGVDVFLEFVPYHEPPALGDLIPGTLPDEGYPFLEPKAGIPEEKTVKLALELFRKRDFALTVRTLDLFLKETPESIHRVDMEFLRANALLRLALDSPAAGPNPMKENAEKLLEKIREKHVGTPASLAAALYLADQRRQEENHLQVVERYLWIAAHYPKHRNVWAWRMMAAEALYAVKQTDRAVAEYEWIEANAPDTAAKASAATRIGDAYLHRGQYDRALAAYYAAGKKFPGEAEKSASLQVNRGESLYWLGQYDRAQEQFEKFNRGFPGHPGGWRALVRLAEIEGRKTGDEAREASRKYLLEAVNRYPFSPGAVIARMRLVPCDDHGGFDVKTAAEFFRRETESFDGGKQIRVDRFAEFRAMIRVRSMILLNDPVSALEIAIAEKDEVNRKSAAHAWLKGMERKLFRKRVIDLLDSGKRYEAVQFFDRYAAKVDLAEEIPEDATPERVAVADPDYLLRLSRVAAELGLGRTAGLIAKRYDSEATKLGLVQNDRAVASGPGTRKASDLETRLKDSERAFTEAKAMWTAAGGESRKKNGEAIRAKLEKVVDESPFSYQREIILGMMAEDAKKWAAALEHATGASALLAKVTREDSIERVAVDQWTAKLQESAGNTRAAVETYRKLQRSNLGKEIPRAKAEGVGLAPIEGTEAWVLREGDLLVKLGRYGEASDAFGRAVGSGVGGNRALYNYALSLEKIGGETSKVESLLKKAAESEQNDFWKELARKKLAGSVAKEGTQL